MFFKVAFLVINIILLGANSQETSENEFLVVSTSESPNKIETTSKIEDTNRHLVAVLTVEAQKSSAKAHENNVESINVQLVQLQKKLQQLETSCEKQEENLEEKSQKSLEMQKKLDQLEKTQEEEQKRFLRIKQELDERNEKYAELQKTINELSEALARIEENVKWESKRVQSVLNDLNAPRNCKEVKESGNRSSGVYLIRPKSRSFNVWCDMDTNGGGWTVLQNRFDGSEDFSRNWTDYKQGFGNLHGEFWLGLQHVYELTDTDPNELLIKLMDRKNTEAEASFDDFTVGSEKTSYSLERLGAYKGTTGDSLQRHLGHKFSTFDRDNSRNDCTRLYSGGWWFIRGCLYSNLNGKYFNDGITKGRAQGINWYDFSSDEYSLLKSKMMIRPR